ncbi:MAG: glycosyltransferase family 4 protein [Alkalinema sp. CAN_BIN05]|nr:glycosyltransferase family 4 protein [Alkalinema sp. CAN_BIN05]
MRILMLSATFPYPPTNGGTQVRTFNLLKYLHPRHEVTIATLRNSDVTPADVAALKEFATEVVVFDRPAAPNSNLISKLQRGLDFLITGTPSGVRSSYSPDLKAWLDRAVKDQKFDVITCEHSVNENYLSPDWKNSLRTVVNVHSSVYATCKNQLETKTAEKPFRDRLNQPLLKRYEQRFSQKFSIIVVTTDDDAQQFKTFAPNTPIATIPNGVDFDDFPYRSADPNNHDLIFIGAMDNLANIDAARFLAQEIFPIVQQRYPDSKLMLVGSRPVPEVLKLNQLPNVVVTGAVPSIADYLHRATVCVIPMRTGFGIKNKTLEAMAAGTPVVSSDRGLEGLTLDPDRPCALRANNPAEYSAAITQLLDNIALRESISHHARAYIERDFTWEQAGRRYESAILGV